jgi:hypothetical protein
MEEGAMKDHRTSEDVQMLRKLKNIDIPSGDCRRKPAGVGCDLQRGISVRNPGHFSADNTFLDRTYLECENRPHPSRTATTAITWVKERLEGRKATGNGEEVEAETEVDEKERKTRLSAV